MAWNVDHLVVGVGAVVVVGAGPVAVGLVGAVVVEGGGGDWRDRHEAVGSHSPHSAGSDEAVRFHTSVAAQTISVTVGHRDPEPDLGTPQTAVVAVDVVVAGDGMGSNLDLAFLKEIVRVVRLLQARVSSNQHSAQRSLGSAWRDSRLRRLGGMEMEGSLPLVVRDFD
jgi:hypothetical protein